MARMEYEQNGTSLGSVNIVAIETVEKQQYHHALEKYCASLSIFIKN